MIQLTVKTTNSQLVAYGQGCSLHIGLYLSDKFLSCLNSENCISLNDWHRWLSR